MLTKKKIIFIISGASVLVILLGWLILRSPSKNTPISPPPVLTVSPSNQPQIPYITYNEAKRSELVNIMKERPKIANSDQSIRVSLISQLGNKSGVITTTKNYVIKYVKAPNIFQVEILTNDYLATKQQATQWFINQGFSKDGICKLPIQFYLSAEVKDNLQDKVDNFNYLPEGC